MKILLFSLLLMLWPGVAGLPAAEPVAAPALAAREFQVRFRAAGQITPAEARPALALVPHCLERGSVTEAEELVRSLEPLAASWSESSEATAVRIELRFRQAQLLARRCRVVDAQKQFEGLHFALTSGRPDLRAEFEDELGALSAWSGQLAESAAHHTAAIGFRRESSDEPGLGRSLNLLGATQLALGKAADAGRCFDDAAALFDRLQDERGRIITRMNQAVLWRARGDLRRAYTEMESVLRSARSGHQPDIEADALGNLAAVLETAGRYREALQLAGESLRLQESFPDCRALARLHNTLGVLCRETGDYARSDSELNSALRLAREHGDREGELAARNNLGWLAAALNQTNRAREVFQTLRDERRTAGDRAGEADALANLAAVLHAARDVEGARLAFSEALSLRRNLGDTNAVASLLINLGACDVAQRQVEPAILRFEEARRMAAASGAAPEEAVAWNNLGMVRKAAGRWPEARAAYQSALLLLTESGDPVGQAVTLNNLMGLAQAEGRRPLAIAYGKEAINRFQNVRSNLLWLDVEAQRSFADYCQPAYRRLADLLIEAGRLPEAQQVMKMLKEEEYHEFIQRDAGAAEGTSLGRNRIEESVWQRYEEISGRIVSLAEEHDRLQREGAPAERLASLGADLGVARRVFLAQLDQVYQEAVTAHPEETASKNLYDVGALRGTLRVLGAGTVLLNYVAADNRLGIILTTPAGQVARFAPVSAAELNQKVFAFREKLRYSHRDPLPLARELYRLVLAPVAADLEQVKATTVMVSLDGTLRYLPLAALHDGSGYVAEKWRFSVFNEAGKDKLREKSQPDWSASALGLTEEVKPYHALPFVAEELNGIVRATPDAAGVLPGIVRLDRDFTAMEFKRALVADRPVLHVASHFVFHPGTVTDSFLLLGDRQRLTLDEIRTNDLRFDGLDLVTLSACETAVSEERPGSGKEFEGFATEAQKQGARAILATLWPVADHSTSVFMQSFYRFCQKGRPMDKAAALQSAQLAFLRGRQEAIPASAALASRGLEVDRSEAVEQNFTPDPKAPYAHPYYWAPFVLIGNWR